MPGVKYAINTIHSSFKVHSEVPKASIETEAWQGNVLTTYCPNLKHPHIVQFGCFFFGGGKWLGGGGGGGDSCLTCSQMYCLLSQPKSTTKCYHKKHMLQDLLMLTKSNQTLMSIMMHSLSCEHSVINYSS